MGAGGPLALYDAISWLGGRTAHRKLVAVADLAPGQTVLEVGCGTGNLLLAAARAQPGATMVGLDPDPAALDRARAKAARRGVPLRLEQGYADDLPHADGSVDRVLSAFMFHHLPAGAKEAMLREVRRVLAPGGALYLVDFEGLPRAYRLFAPVMRVLGHGHGHGHGDDDATPTPVANDAATVRSLLTAAGFTDVAAIETADSPFGRWISHRAVRGD
jgi:ubiquinone/menaquinone biosynthesis C-methylase UbiE